MNKRAKRKGGRKAAGAGQLWLRLPGLVREALYDTVIGGAWRVWTKSSQRFCG